jgi:caa(3)-type oxidase subunit IV
MSNENDSKQVMQQVRQHVRIFMALVVFTFVTVGASYLQIQSPVVSVCIALAVALVEAFLVAGFMMHLSTERKIIHVVLVLTVFFFTAMMYLILWANQPGNRLGHQLLSH